MKTLSRLGLVLFAVCIALCVGTRVAGQGIGALAADESLPGIRRVLVPADRVDQWLNGQWLNGQGLNGEWQPIPLMEFERLFDRAAAGHRPRPFIERADYWATIDDGELKDARAEWHVRRPDSSPGLLSPGLLSTGLLSPAR